MRLDEIKACIVFNEQWYVNQHLHVHTKIGDPFRPSAISAAENGRAREEQFISVRHPLRCGGVLAIQGK